ncbi:hypothetical protein [Parasphingorhabdus sp.]|uniref:hypothetical protein n=1 Tax=Parasphingorhabdus sp. TaxID=2709688 RepID=UPI0030A83514
MGGIGSGRRSSRMTKDECIRLDLAHLKQLGMLKRHCLNRRVVSWSCRGRRTAELTVVADVHCNEPYPCLKFTGYANGQSVDCMVWLDCVPMPFGGERWYALCPMTVRKCTTLVLPPGQSRFASVKGWGVSYGSQRECPIHRGHRAIDKAEARLKALSKYTRKPTRERLLDRLIERQVFVEEEIDKLAQMVF